MSRRHRAAARRAMPFRAWIVVERDAHWDESSPRIIVARTQSQAARVWREATGYTVDDFGTDELNITPAVWEWPTVPEPAWPKKPCEWSPVGRAPDGDELWRGYGLRAEDDIRCDGCDELVADERITYANFAEASDVPLCPECLAECREKGEVAP